MKPEQSVYNKLHKFSAKEEPMKVELGIAEELASYIALANKVEQMGKDLYAKESKATQLLKEANKLLEPLGNFVETQVESALKDLERAGLQSSDAYKELKSSYDYTSRANATVKRMSRNVASAIN
jgi:hypothetical protein